MKALRNRTLEKRFAYLSEHSEEWDFRTIHPGHIDYASIYDHGRKCEWVREAFCKWHQQKLAFPKAVGALKRWNGITIEKALYRMQHCEAPWEVTAFIEGGGPEGMERNDNVELIFFLSHLFPVPFLQVANIDDIIHAAKDLMPLPAPRPAFRSLGGMRRAFAQWPHSKILWDDPEYVRRMSSLGVRKYEIVIDHRHSKERINRENSEWIDRLDVKGVKKFSVKKGVAASAPLHELKELAAYHMSKLGLTWSQAQKFLRDYITKHPVEHGLSVLPFYSSAGWSGALSNVEARIAKLFPPPGPSNPAGDDFES